MKPLKQELQERGLIYQINDEKIFDLLDKGGVNFYLGFDPSADSIHLGNFIGFMVAYHIMRRGNTFTALTGGATGMIGDPGGKSAERNFLDVETLQHNTKSIYTQLGNIANNLENYTGEKLSYNFVNNMDFYKEMTFIDFLREVGKYITINVMMSKEAVKKRIEDPNLSISYTEFSYQLMQGYDYMHMFKERNMLLQIGGQDQWGNLVTGTELIRKRYDADSFVLTWPLLLDSTGRKFGKSEGNAMFLSKQKTSPYFIYQYFMNTADEDLGRFFKTLTLYETEEIDEMLVKFAENPEKREGQKLLAYKVVEIIHGEEEAKLCQQISEFMFGENDKMEILKNLNSEELETFKSAMGGFNYSGENLFETIVSSGLASSNSEARNSVSSGAIFINEEKVSDPKFDVNANFIDDKFLLVRKGKKNFKLVLKK